MGSSFGSVISFLTWLAAAGPSEPDDVTKSIALLPLQWEGEPNPGARPQLQGRLNDAFTDGDGISWVPASAVAGALESAGGKCPDLACQRAVGESVDARYVVVPKTTLRDRVYRIELRAIDVADGTVVAETAEFCEICGVEEVADLIAAQASTLQPTLAALVQGRPVLEVVTAPPGAHVIVDGTELGTTPLTVELDAGRHVVRLEAPGRIPQERQILSVEGARETLNVELPTSPTTGTGGRDDAETGADRRGRAMTGWGGASLGVGLGMIGAGIPLMVIHDRQNRRRCSGDDVDVNGTCRYSYDTMGAGIGLTVGGAILTATGIALVSVGAKRKRSGRSATLRPSFGWRTIGIVGEF